MMNSFIDANGNDYTPISAWGYIGYQILFAIPLVGFIMLLVFAFGGTKNVNLKNFSRSYLIVMLIAIVISIIALILMLALGVLMSNY